MPDAWQGLGIASLGIYGGSGHLLMTRAFCHAPASTLSPFLYTQLIWAVLLGWLFYDHLPDLLSARFRQTSTARDSDTAG